MMMNVFILPRHSFLHRQLTMSGLFSRMSAVIIPNRIIFTTTHAGYIAPEGEQFYNMYIPGNYFEAEVSADATVNPNDNGLVIMAGS